MRSDLLAFITPLFDAFQAHPDKLVEDNKFKRQGTPEGERLQPRLEINEANLEICIYIYIYIYHFELTITEAIFY